MEPGGPVGTGRVNLSGSAHDLEVLQMYDDYYRRGGGILGAFILGGLIGAALGLLFAPRSGKETREMIASKADEYWGQGVEMYNTGKEKAAEYYEKGMETAGDAGDAMRDKIDSARSRLQEQVAKASDTARGAVSDYAPVAKEQVGKAAEGAKKGVDVAADAARQGIDTVADKAGKPGAPAEPAPTADSGKMESLPEI